MRLCFPLLGPCHFLAGQTAAPESGTFSEDEPVCVACPLATAVFPVSFRYLEGDKQSPKNSTGSQCERLPVERPA